MPRTLFLATLHENTVEAVFESAGWGGGVVLLHKKEIFTLKLLFLLYPWPVIYVVLKAYIMSIFASYWQHTCTLAGTHCKWSGSPHASQSNFRAGVSF